jgi:hypothetical protein
VGVVRAEGRLGEGVVNVFFGLVRPPEGARVSAAAFIEALVKLDDRCRLARADRGKDVFGVELQVQAAPLTLARAGALVDQIRIVNEVATFLRQEIPQRRTAEDLRKLYRPVSEVLEPVVPLEDAVALSGELELWVRDTAALACAGIPVALAAPAPVVADFAAAALARAEGRSGRSLGRLVPPAMNMAALIDLASKAPGGLLVPVTRLALGTSAYDMQGQMQGLLAALAAGGRPAFFVGSFEQLQALFHGGQGAVIDPLFPAVRRVPDVSFEMLVGHGVRAAAGADGLGHKAEDDIARAVRAALDPLPRAEQTRFLLPAARWAVASHVSARATSPPSGPPPLPAGGLVEVAKACKETLAGLPRRPRASRSPAVAERFVRGLTSPDLLAHLRRHLLAQDQAITKLVRRLQAEALTRPDREPLRWCAEGPPGVGKSESAALIAEWLEVPYVNVDAASLSDFHTASAQLLGSGRGIVGSYQAGRLEQAAKHHDGVLIEISDIDHAPEHARSFLADLFLQVLGMGEAQSAVGAMFSCANVIFCFSMNLAARTDQIYRSVGFGPPPDGDELDRLVAREIGGMLSTAWVSRMGTPIVFRPLSGDALGELVERAVAEALRSGFGRLGLGAPALELEPGLGVRLYAEIARRVSSLGARAAFEHARAEAAAAVLDAPPGAAAAPRLRASLGPGGNLILEPCLPE